MERLFKLKQNGTTAGREVIAGLTTFFAMAYIIAVNPSILSQAGMEWGAVFLATIIASIIGTLIMGLILNILQLLGVSSYWQRAVTGAIIIGTVAIDSISGRKRD